MAQHFKQLGYLPHRHLRSLLPNYTTFSFRNLKDASTCKIMTCPHVLVHCHIPQKVQCKILWQLYFNWERESSNAQHQTLRWKDSQRLRIKRLIVLAIHSYFFAVQKHCRIWRALCCIIISRLSFWFKCTQSSHSILSHSDFSPFQNSTKLQLDGTLMDWCHPFIDEILIPLQHIDSNSNKVIVMDTSVKYTLFNWVSEVGQEHSVPSNSRYSWTLFLDAIPGQCQTPVTYCWQVWRHG